MPAKKKTTKVLTPQERPAEKRTSLRVILVTVICLLAVFDLALLWTLVGEPIFYPTKDIAHIQTQVRELLTVQRSRADDAEFLEEKINTLSVSAADLAVINQIVAQQKALVESVQSDLTTAEKDIAQLSALKEPFYRSHPAVTDRSFVVTLRSWVEHANAYYAHRSNYFKTLQNIAYLQEQIAALSFTTDDSATALTQYNNLLSTYTATREVVDAFAKEQGVALTKLQSALEQEQGYIDLSKQFYEADKAKNIAKQKTLRDQLVAKEKELGSADLYSELSDYEQSVLQKEHDTLKILVTELAAAAKKLS